VQLRHAMVGQAVAGHPPNEILAAINRLLLRQRAGRASAAVVATYRPDSHRPTWARAGHPPILVANRDGVEALWHPAGAVLGVLPEAHYADATSRIAAGDLVVMYTDGSVEERGRMLDDGVHVFGDQARLAMTGPLGGRPRSSAASVVAILTTTPVCSPPLRCEAAGTRTFVQLTAASSAPKDAHPSEVMDHDD
jgi:hypothetical protein